MAVVCACVCVCVCVCMCVCVHVCVCEGGRKGTVAIHILSLVSLHNRSQSNVTSAKVNPDHVASYEYITITSQ